MKKGNSFPHCSWTGLLALALLCILLLAGCGSSDESDAVPIPQARAASPSPAPTLPPSPATTSAQTPPPAPTASRVVPSPTPVPTTATEPLPTATPPPLPTKTATRPAPTDTPILTPSPRLDSEQTDQFPAGGTAVFTPVASETVTISTATSTPVTSDSFPESTPSATVPVPLDATFEDPGGFYTLQYPSDWIPHRSGSEMQFWTDAQGDASIAVSLHVKAFSPETLIDSISALLSTRLDFYQQFSRQETTLGGYPAIIVTQAHRWAAIPYQGLMVGGVRNRIGFLLLVRAPVADMGELRQTFLDIISSFSVTEFDEAPEYGEWLTYESEHGVFHALPDTWAAENIESIADDHEWAMGGITETLQVDYEGPIHFYLYPSTESLYRATARQYGFAISEGQEVHTLWASATTHQSLGHEQTHVITYWTLGEPSEALLGEGTAVCLDHSGRDPHATASDLMAEGRLVPLSEALGNDWFAHDATLMYSQSGSFACFLLENYGAEPFQALYAQPDMEAALVMLYGKDLLLLEREWHQMLGER